MLNKNHTLRILAIVILVLFSTPVAAQEPGDSLGLGWSSAMYIKQHNNPYGHDWSAVDEVYGGYDFDGDGNLEFYYITDESNPNSSGSGPIVEYDDGAFVYLYEYNPSSDAFEQVWMWADTAYSNGGASFPTSAVGDLDGDGNLELLLAIPTYVSTGNPTRFWVFESEAGVGLPSTPTATWNFDASPNGDIRASAMAVADIDGDGEQEVAVAFRKFSDVGSNDARMIFSLDGSFTGPFTQWTIEDFDSSDMGSVYAAAITDVDNDGNLEAYFATDYITLYEASGADTYVRSDNVDAGSDHWNLTNSAISYDADGDGNEELLYATWSSSSAAFRMVYGATDAQNIDSTHIYTVYEFGGGCRAFIAGDFDADGLTDVFFAQNYGPVWHGEYSGSGAVTDGNNWTFEFVWQDTIPSGGVRPYTISFPGDARNYLQTGNTITDMNGNSNPELLIAIEDGDSGQAWVVMLEGEGSQLPGPHISVAPSNLDFGVLEVGQSATLQLMVHSIGDDTVSVTSITNSMPDYSVNPTSLVIPPGQTAQVDVTFSPLSIGVIEDSLTIGSNDPDDPIVTVFLSGEGEAGDLMVSIYSTFGEPGDTVIVPVQVTETGSYTINSAEFELVSDSILVRSVDASFDGALPEGTDWILQYNAEPDSFSVAMGGADTLSGSGDLVVLRYVIDSTAVRGQSSDLAFHSFLFNEGIPIATILGGRIDVGIPYGDVSRDGGVHAYDGAMIMMYLAGQITFDQNQEIVAEVSGDGNITSFDASLILQYVVGLIDEFPAAGGAMPPLSPAAAFDIPDLSAAPGEIIIFPVTMEDVHDVVSLEARLEYDPSILTLEEFIVSDDFDGWLKSDVMEEGALSLYLAHGTPVGGDLLLGEARFRVSEEASEGCEIALKQVRINEEPVVENAASAQFSLTVTGVLGESDGIPLEYGLSQNYPNPFNPVTEIRYALPEDARVKLSIYNLLGQEVARLVDSDMPAGYHRVKWDAGRVASGVYIYRIKARNYAETLKMVLLR